MKLCNDTSVFINNTEFYSRRTQEQISGTSLTYNKIVYDLKQSKSLHDKKWLIYSYLSR